MNNWESRIRKFIKIHPDFFNLDPWIGTETSDITYEDNQGTLTKFFIDKGYLNLDDWRDKKPKYYIEVKTTTGPCSTRLFMSKGQYRMVMKRPKFYIIYAAKELTRLLGQMQENFNGTNGRENQMSIYVIFRVYNLGQRTMGLKLYMNPEAMRIEKTLVFQEESGWSVRPQNHNPFILFV